MKPFRMTLIAAIVAVTFAGSLANAATAQQSAKDTDAAAADKFEANPSFGKAIRSAMRKNNVRFWTRVKVWRALRDDEMRYELELALTEHALKTGAIQPEGVDGSGVYGGPWTDFLDWIVANWDDIFRIVMTIVDLFLDDQPAIEYGYDWPADDGRYCLLDADQCKCRLNNVARMPSTTYRFALIN